MENAIKHGVEPKVGPVRIDVAVQRDADDPYRLVIEVRDNGVGLQAESQTRGTGLGLRSVRDRLKLLYGEDASLAVSGAPGGGVIARLSFPCKLAQVDGASSPELGQPSIDPVGAALVGPGTASSR